MLGLFEKIENTYDLLRDSLTVLSMDKELLIFPIIAGLASLVVMASFVGPLFLTDIPQQLFTGAEQAAEAAQAADPVTKFLGIMYIFCFYLVLSFVTIFCNCALISAALIRLDGGDPTVRDGLRAARERIWAILGWAVLSATVGLLLNMLESRGRERGAGIRIVASLLGAAWSVATYLALPVIAAEGLGPIDALKRSASLLKETWGEQIVGNYSLGCLISIVGLLGAAMLGMIGLALAGPVGAAILLVLWVVALAIVTQTLSGIYKAALYYFATGKSLPPYMRAELLEGAFVPRE